MVQYSYQHLNNGQNCPLFRPPFEYRTTYCPLFRPPFEYRTTYQAAAAAARYCKVRYSDPHCTMSCPIKINSNTIELTVHTSCYSVLDLLCVITILYFQVLSVKQLQHFNSSIKKFSSSHPFAAASNAVGRSSQCPVTASTAVTAATRLPAAAWTASSHCRKIFAAGIIHSEMSTIACG